MHEVKICKLKFTNKNKLVYSSFVFTTTTYEYSGHAKSLKNAEKELCYIHGAFWVMCSMVDYDMRLGVLKQ